MEKRALLIASFLVFTSGSGLAANDEPIKSKALVATYRLYSGELGEEQAPTKKDRKLAIKIRGPAAKEIFDSIYPDTKLTCTSQPGERQRNKKNVWCSYYPDIGYRCFIGFNLRTGESIPGAIC